MSRLFTGFVMTMLLAAPVIGQKTDGGQAKADAQPAPARIEKKTTADPRMIPAPLRYEPATNIRVDLTITDQRGSATPISKTITMTMADNASSRIRTGGDVRTPMGFRPVTLNVDAMPRVQRDGKIYVTLTIEYRPTAAESDTEQSTTPTINESLAVLLEDGKSTVISQSADPATDRKVKVEAKAAILR
jgi:hypothetical protein